MFEIIFYLVISLLVSLLFVVAGIKQYNSKTPVSINSGEKPPLEEELTSVTEWNQRHGRDLIIFGCALFLTMAVFVYMLTKFDNPVLETVLFLVLIFAEIAGVIVDDRIMKKKLIKH